MNKVFGKKILWTATALWAASAVSAAAFEPDPFGREPDKAKPYAELEPSYNITSFMDAKPQPAAGVEKETDDIYFSADEMIDNKDMQTITAVGDVNIIRKGRQGHLQPERRYCHGRRQPQHRSGRRNRRFFRLCRT